MKLKITKRQIIKEEKGEVPNENAFAADVAAKIKKVISKVESLYTTPEFRLTNEIDVKVGDILTLLKDIYYSAGTEPTPEWHTARMKQYAIDQNRY